MSYPSFAPVINPVGQNGMIPDMPDIPDLPDASGSSGFSSNTPVSGGGLVDFGGLVDSFRDVGSSLDSANKSETAFVQGHGNLLEMALERAKADTLLSLASATASKTTQAASTLMNLQV